MYVFHIFSVHFKMLLINDLNLNKKYLCLYIYILYKFQFLIKYLQFHSIYIYFVFQFSVQTIRLVDSLTFDIIFGAFKTVGLCPSMVNRDKGITGRMAILQWRRTSKLGHFFKTHLRLVTYLRLWCFVYTYTFFMLYHRFLYSILYI